MMKKAMALFGLVILCAHPAPAWRPAGWVCAWAPFMYDHLSGDWYWMSAPDAQWVYRLAPARGWSGLNRSGLTHGWSRFRWPYAFDQDTGGWNYLSPGGAAWCVNLRTREWSRFGQPAAAVSTDLTLTVTSLTGSMVGFSWEPQAYNWPSKMVGVECDAIVEMRRANGQGGKFDWIRKGGQSRKGLENIYDGYGVWSRVGVPVSGERVTFRWVSVDGRKRSNDAPAIWP